MYNPRRVLKQWRKCDERRQYALKTEFLTHQDDPSIQNDFITFLAVKFGLHTDDSTPSQKGKSDKS